MKGKPGKTIRTGFGNESGMPSIDYSLCSKCGNCVKVCKSFTIIDDGGRPVVDIDNGLGCIACGQCMAVCPKGAVTVTGRKLSFSDAFLLPPKEKRATPEALMNLLVSRRSVRDFRDRVPERRTIERILGMAATAPMGIPPSDVGVTVVEGSQRVQELAGDVTAIFRKWQTFFNPAVMPLMRPFFKKGEFESFKDFILPATRLMIDARKTGTDYLFYHAPVVLLFHQSPYADPVDGHIACTYAMVAAESLGLGTCMIGTVAFALDREKKIKEKWGIPTDNKVALAMIMGYPVFTYKRGLRRTFANIEYK